MNEQPTTSKGERKKARRKKQNTAERSVGRDLDAIAEAAVTEAMRLAPEVAAAASAQESERAIEVAVTTIDAARFVRKRINEALAFGEWLDEVQVWVWQADKHSRPPLSEIGRDQGVELRLEHAARPQP
jgi:hypothetical protein